MLRERAIPILKAVSIPLIIIAALESASGFISTQENISKPISLILTILLELISLFQYTYVAVCTHRIVILGIGSVPEWGLKKYTSREGIFFFYSLLLTVLSVIVVSTSQFAQSIWISFIPWLFAGYITIRFSLIFPACAIDQYISLKQSWILTQRKFVFMLFSTIIWPFLLVIPILFLMLGMTFVGGTIIPLIGVIVGSIFGVLFTIVLISSLSLAYVRILDEKTKAINNE